MTYQTIFTKKQWLVVALVGLLLSACTCNTEQAATTTENSMSTMKKPQLRHVVLIKFKEDASPEGIEKVEKAFAALQDKIPQIKDFEWGTNNSPEGLDKGFTHCFFVTFDSEEDRAVYLPHPDHMAFVEVLKPVMADAMVVDYWVKS